MAKEDPNLALAGLRIEIEKLLKLAERRNIEVRSRGIDPLFRKPFVLTTLPRGVGVPHRFFSPLVIRHSPLPS